jgi:hypothetical protein
MSSTYRWSRAAPLILFFGLVGMLAYYFLAMPAVRPHSGDGHFANLSWRFPWPYCGIPIPGYTIDFPQFDLATEFDATYHLENLPELPGKVGLYLSISDPNKIWRDDELRKQLVATIQFDVYDELGELICHVQQPLAKMWWASPEGGDYGLYNLDESFFVPRTGARYTLRVRYSPDPKFSGLKGFVHIRCGGSI